GFEVRRALTADELESLQRGCTYNPRQDKREAFDRLRCNLALDEPGSADSDQADIGRFLLDQLGDSAVDNRVWQRSFVIAAFRRKNACLFAGGREGGGFAAEVGAGNGDLVGSSGLGLRQGRLLYLLSGCFL